MMQQPVRQNIFRQSFAQCVLACAVLSLTGCAVGPDYVKPDTNVPQSYKESKWKLAEANDAYPADAWWNVYQDERLNNLMTTLQKDNVSIAIAEAQYRQAEALLRQAQAGLFPSVSLGGGMTRGMLSTASTTIQSSYSATATVGWQLDLWGSVRRTIEAGRAGQEASAAQLAAAKLSAQAQLATAYLQLTIADQQIASLTQSQKNLIEVDRIINNQYAAGTASDADVSLSNTQLKSSQAALVDLRYSRTLLEHAIAALLGKMPAEFSLEPANTLAHLPTIPATVPSTLLERRPDIQVAERNMAQANAKVGVAQAAYFPTLSLSASGGYRSSVLSDLISLPNRIWSIGPQLAMSIFDAGIHMAQKAQAVAAYDQAVATYRQTVLSAFQGVEDNMAAQALLRNETELLRSGLKSAERSETIVLNQYKAGIVGYMNVLTAQNTRITVQNSLWSLMNRQYTSSVSLISALGGQW